MHLSETVNVESFRHTPHFNAEDSIEIVARAMPLASADDEAHDEAAGRSIPGILTEQPAKESYV